jgi:hypothetical protein
MKYPGVFTGRLHNIQMDGRRHSGGENHGISGATAIGSLDQSWMTEWLADPRLGSRARTTLAASFLHDPAGYDCTDLRGSMCCFGHNGTALHRGRDHLSPSDGEPPHLGSGSTRSRPAGLDQPTCARLAPTGLAQHCQTAGLFHRRQRLAAPGRRLARRPTTNQCRGADGFGAATRWR